MYSKCWRGCLAMGLRVWELEGTCKRRSSTEASGDEIERVDKASRAIELGDASTLGSALSIIGGVLYLLSHRLKGADPISIPAVVSRALTCIVGRRIGDILTEPSLELMASRSKNSISSDLPYCKTLLALATHNISQYLLQKLQCDEPSSLPS